MLDPEYYAQRAAAERAIARATKDRATARIHEELAERYESRAGLRSPNTVTKSSTETNNT